MKTSWHTRTRAVHTGEEFDPATGASTPAIVPSTSFVTSTESSFSAGSLEPDSDFIYTRWGNPTVRRLEKKVAALEGAESAVAFGSGMAAVVSILLHYLHSGDRLVLSDVLYAGVAEFARTTLENMNVEVDFVNMADLDSVEEALSSPAKVVLVETPCNPLLRLTDIEAVAEYARDAGARLVVDSTFASPISTRPLSLGADLVVHSLTKYMGGHGDALGGIVAGAGQEIHSLRKQTAIRVGSALSPFNAWLILRGLVTLPIRMQAHENGALQIARFLESHPKVVSVQYPGLPSHPQYELAQRQMSNFSGMVAFRTDDVQNVADRLAQKLQIIQYAVSLGHHHSLLFYLPTEYLISHSFRMNGDQLEAYKAIAGDGLFRLSTGLEDPDDLCRDLEQALAEI